jgi:hypothetical protein
MKRTGGRCKKFCYKMQVHQFFLLVPNDVTHNTNYIPNDVIVLLGFDAV